MNETREVHSYIDSLLARGFRGRVEIHFAGSGNIGSIRVIEVICHGTDPLREPRAATESAGDREKFSCRAGRGHSKALT
jgi:hypothetical protein